MFTPDGRLMMHDARCSYAWQWRLCHRYNMSKVHWQESQRSLQQDPYQEHFWTCQHLTVHKLCYSEFRPLETPDLIRSIQDWMLLVCLHPCFKAHVQACIATEVVQWVKKWCNKEKQRINSNWVYHFRGNPLYSNHTVSAPGGSVLLKKGFIWGASRGR